MPAGHYDHKAKGPQSGSYQAIHSQLKRHRGPAAEYHCACGAVAVHWSRQQSDTEIAERAFRAGVRWARDQAENDRVSSEMAARYYGTE